MPGQPPSFLRAAADDVRMALAFLTRLPVSISSSVPVPGALAHAMWAFPFAGVVTGFIGGAVFIVTTAFGLPHLVSSTIAVAAMIGTTGALHEDGLADMADANGGVTQEHKLEIMQDSRTGAYGVIALILALLLRVIAISAYANEKDSMAVLLLLISAGAASRAAIVATAYFLPAVRPNGLSASAGQPTLMILTQSSIIAIAITLLSLTFPLSIASMIGCMAGAVAVSAMARRLLGGQTGDVLGACQQIAEIGFLLGALVLAS